MLTVSQAHRGSRMVRSVCLHGVLNHRIDRQAEQLKNILKLFSNTIVMASPGTLRLHNLTAL